MVCAHMFFQPTTLTNGWHACVHSAQMLCTLSCETIAYVLCLLRTPHRPATYPSWPERYTLVNKKWHARRSWPAHANDVRHIGRVHNAHPSAGEVFYLRMLLHHVTADLLALEPGNADAFGFEVRAHQVSNSEIGVRVISFPMLTCARAANADAAQALKYFEGQKYETYKGAAMARNLLQDDGEWRMALQDAADVSTARQMRALYLYIVEWNQPEAPAALFEEFWEAMAEDLAYELRRANLIPTERQVRLRLLLDLEETLESTSKSLADMCGLTLTDSERDEARELAHSAILAREPRAIRDELTPEQDRAQLRARTDEAVHKLLPEQRRVFDAVMSSLSRREGRCVFVDAPGGTGKTFTFNAILGAVRAQGKIALAVASSGIAAILLEKGRTFHARFSANRSPAEDQMLKIQAQSTQAQLLRRASVILWDEAAMGNKHHLDALDRTLRDFMQIDEPFGGKIVILGGDFRQTLPIQKKASRAQTLRITLVQSHLWPHFDRFRLHTNMRIQRMRDTLDSNDSSTAALLTRLEEFSQWLLDIGNDDIESDVRQHIALPSPLCLPEGCDVDALAQYVYPELESNCRQAFGETSHQHQLRVAAWLSQRAMLAAYNTDVIEVRMRSQVCARAIPVCARAHRRMYPCLTVVLCHVVLCLLQLNAHMSSNFPGSTMWTCKSADAIDDAEPELSRVGEEVLNAFTGPNLPLHELQLKPLMPIMLLRNLDPANGLCNGTRMLVIDVTNMRVLRAMILAGAHAGKIVAIPRIKLWADEGEFPFKWSRRQFPVRVGAHRHLCPNAACHAC